MRSFHNHFFFARNKSTVTVYGKVRQLFEATGFDAVANCGETYRTCLCGISLKRTVTFDHVENSIKRNTISASNFQSIIKGDFPDTTCKTCGISRQT